MTAARAALAAAITVLALAAAGPAEAQRELRVPGRPVVVLRADLPPTHLFGDRVRARLTVAVNPVLADPDSLRADARFAPYRVVEVAAGRAGEARGGRVVVRYDYLLECLQRVCLPSDDPVEFPDARVDYRTSDGEEAEPLSVEWPELAVVSRLSEEDLEQPQFRASAPAVEARGARGLAWALAAAALLVLVLGVLAAWLLARPPRAAPVLAAPPGGSPLDAAFAVLERPAARTAEERRVALDTLARSLERSGRRELAARARRLAWLPSPPPPAAVEELVAAVRREAA